MKKILILSALCFSATVAHGQAMDEDPLADPDQAGPMNLFEQNELVTEKFNEALAEIQTHEMFAGRRTEIKFRGKNYIIDRSMEAVKSKPGVAAKPTSLGVLLGDLSARTSGRIEVRVIQREYENGKIKSEEIWEINLGGMWEAQTGMPDATGKAHK